MPLITHLRRFLVGSTFVFLLCTAAVAFASGSGDSSSSSSSSSALPPYVFKGRITGPSNFQTAWQERYLSAPIYADISLSWDAHFVGLNPILSAIYTSDCQLRRLYDGGYERVRTGVGWTGTYSFKAGEVTHGHHDEGDVYALFCKLRYYDPPDSVEDRRYARISDVNTSGFELEISHCESSFTFIAQSLGVAVPPDDDTDSYTYSGVLPITENSFREWAGGDSFDYCDFGGWECTKTLAAGEAYHSGDQEDIKRAMEGAQCSVPNVQNLQDMLLRGDFGGGILDGVMSVTDGRQPAPFAVLSLSALHSNTVAAHALIGLSVTKSMTAGLRYYLEALDSNGPQLVSMNCNVRSVELAGKTASGVVCDHPDLGESVPIGGFGSINGLRSIFLNYCSHASTSEFCTSRQNMTYWLKNNYPQISNYRTNDFPGGICYGWTNFVLAVAYRGNFVGECPRP